MQAANENTITKTLTFDPAPMLMLEIAKQGDGASQHKFVRDLKKTNVILYGPVALDIFLFALSNAASLVVKPSPGGSDGK